MIICKYHDMIFVADRTNKLVNQNWIIRFLNFFDGNDDIFITSYKNKYPNRSIQIYKHHKKPLRREIKAEIDYFIKINLELRRDIRDRNIQKILNFNKV